MSGSFIVLVVAAIGWLFASLFVLRSSPYLDSSVSGFLRLLILFICTQVELNSDAGARLFGAQAPVRQSMGTRSAPPASCAVAGQQDRPFLQIRWHRADTD